MQTSGNIQVGDKNRWSPVQALMIAAQRLAVQLPRARCRGTVQNTNDLAREAVNCNGLFGAYADF